MPASLAQIRARLDASPKAAGTRFAAIIDWARKAIDDAMDSAGVDAIINQAHLLYDTYVMPFDIPWVPDILEPAVIDRPAKQLLAALIRGFYDLVDDEDDVADAGDDTDVVQGGGLE